VRIAGDFVAAVRSCACRESSADGRPSLHVWDVVQSAPESTTIEVRRNGELLDSGPIAPRSLTLGGDGRMYWRHDGALRSAPLRSDPSR
jgi:hypothetical protein